jgi:hypothetical protein
MLVGETGQRTGLGKFLEREAHRAQADGSPSPITNSASPKPPPILPSAGFAAFKLADQAPDPPDKAAFRPVPQIGTVRVAREVVGLRAIL